MNYYDLLKSYYAARTPNFRDTVVDPAILRGYKKYGSISGDTTPFERNKVTTDKELIDKRRNNLIFNRLVPRVEGDSDVNPFLRNVPEHERYEKKQEQAYNEMFNPYMESIKDYREAVRWNPKSGYLENAKWGINPITGTFDRMQGDTLGMARNKEPIIIRKTQESDPNFLQTLAHEGRHKNQEMVNPNMSSKDLREVHRDIYNMESQYAHPLEKKKWFQKFVPEYRSIPQRYPQFFTLNNTGPRRKKFTP